MQFGAPIYRLSDGAPANKQQKMSLRFHYSHHEGGNPVFLPTATISARTLTSVGGIREDRRYRRHADKKQRQQLSGTPGAARHIEEVSERGLGRRLIARDERVRFDASKYLPAKCNRRGNR